MTNKATALPDQASLGFRKTETSSAIVVNDEEQAKIIEQVIADRDLSKLSAQHRVSYYLAMCERSGLDALACPFEYLYLDGKMVLYARREATDQLRSIHSISITKIETEMDEILSLFTVIAYAQDGEGRTDVAIGVVNLHGLQGKQLANAKMKCETKAKRRVTLSLCGLGLLDESEVSSVPGQLMKVDHETGEILEVEAVVEEEDLEEAAENKKKATEDAVKALLEAHDSTIGDHYKKQARSTLTPKEIKKKFWAEANRICMESEWDITDLGTRKRDELIKVLKGCVGIEQESN